MFLGAAAAAAVAVVAVNALTSVGGSDRGTGGGGGASCPSSLRVAGHEYRSAGDLLREPVPGARVGKALLPGGCVDGGGSSRDGTTVTNAPEPDYTVDAFKVPGVSVDDAVLANGKIWVNEERTSLPPAVVDSRREQPCALASVSVVTGKLVNVHPKRAPKVDGDVTAPFTASLYSSDRALTGGRWQTVLVGFRVPAEGDVTGLAGMRDLLYKGKTAEVRLRCAGAKYVADSVKVAGP
ncbi:hypothetical protein KRR39_08290 [Nocardioides panacis]|uniref:Uncharacterized protein n=1 Tax=Nocardioides panacis TaxID=2849501 RepID=A0A975T2L5_9ACTN|nr:hypothetical protein [Nocardioides panacis]QWZ09723.1 hypothetical protein KRR39_08290 [Nocardioides panacis]